MSLNFTFTIWFSLMNMPLFKPVLQLAKFLHQTAFSLEVRKWRHTIGTAFLDIHMAKWTTHEISFFDHETV